MAPVFKVGVGALLQVTCLALVFVRRHTDHRIDERSNRVSNTDLLDECRVPRSVSRAVCADSSVAPMWISSTINAVDEIEFGSSGGHKENRHLR